METWKKSYSQFGEDILLDHIFDNIFKIPKGFYVDFGCFHPQKYSNTARLFEAGWRGLNVDANPASIALFEEARPGDINIASGVADEAAELDFFVFRGGAASTFDPKLKSVYENKGWAVEKIITVPVETPSKILSSNLPFNQFIDYVNIDIEGMDDRVIRSFDFLRHRPHCITIETGNSTIGDGDSNIVSFMKSKGYRYYSQIAITSFFLNSSH